MSQARDPHLTQTQLTPDVSNITRADELASDLVERWQRGERVPAEAYLQRYTNLDEDSAFELVLTEVVLRQEFGEPASVDEFIWRFPQFGDRLRRHFAMHASLGARTVDDGATEV